MLDLNFFMPNAPLKGPPMKAWLRAMAAASVCIAGCGDDALESETDGLIAQKPGSQIVLSSTALDFSWIEGANSPPSQSVTLGIANQNGNKPWVATSDQPWLAVSPGNGTLANGEQATLSVSVNPTVPVEAWTGSTSIQGAPTSGWGVWTGSAMLIWGDNLTQNGKFYDPTSNRWYGQTSSQGAPSTRTLFSAVWTGTEMIVWGGITFWDGTPLDTGGRYNPATNTWQPVSTVGAPSPRFAHTAVWTGTHMVVWGGDSGGFSYKNSGGVYDPSTDTWIRATTLTDVPPARGYHAAVWTGTRMIIWGGENPSKFDTGAFYDPATDAWVGTTSTSGVLSARSHLAAIWTGREMILWGGGSGGPHLDTGKRYNPTTDTWSTDIPLDGAPPPRASHVMVWTGSRVIVWGGSSDTGLINSGGLYRPPLSALPSHTGSIDVFVPGSTNNPQTVSVSLAVTP